MNFPDVSMYFDLEGMETDGKIFFNEYDSSGMHTGFWTFQKDLNRYKGLWQNPDKTMDFEITMYDEFWNPGFRKDYHKKMSTYTGEIDGKALQFEIIRQHADPIQMEWFDLTSFNRTLSPWECNDAFCNNFLVHEIPGYFALSDPGLIAQVENDEIVWSLPNKSQEVYTSFSILFERVTKIKAAIDLNHKVILEYPVFKDKRASRRIDRFCERLLDTLKTDLTLNAEAVEEMNSRWMNFAHAWFEIYYWDDEILSGKWVIQRNWTDEHWSIPINYYLKSDDYINIREQFKSDFDVDFFLEHYIKNGVKELPEYRDLLMRNKLQKAEFEYMNICKAGLVLSTGFDTIFGTFRLIIPFEEIEQYLRKRSILKKLLESRIDD